MKRNALSLFAAVALFFGLCLSFVDFAFSIPASQKDCDLDTQSTSSTSFVVVPNSSVTVDNGNKSRNCVISFSAEAQTTDEGDIVEVAYAFSFLGGACVAGIGPNLFHVGNPWETHTNITVFNLGPGVHTIQPCFRLNDFDGGSGNAQLNFRCLVVECKTK